jgi:hypothetical protein
MTALLSGWTPEASRDFGRAELEFDHALHARPMFSDEGLAEVLDRYPRDRLGVFTMGDDAVAWRTWRRGAAGDMSGEQIMRAVAEGRIWLNLRDVNRWLPEYAALSDELFAAKAAGARGLKTFKRDVALLISSPSVQVFYHLDVPLVSLWQLRGRKRVWLYPPHAPFVDEAQLERIVLRESAEQFAYNPAWDASARVVDLEPGRMVTWRQNAPHRIENGPMVNVSLSVEFMTPRALLRANMIYGAGVLRRRTGLAVGHDRALGPGMLAKAAVARAAKALKLQAAHETKLPVTFRLDQAAPSRTVDLAA